MNQYTAFTIAQKQADATRRPIVVLVGKNAQAIAIGPKLKPQPGQSFKIIRPTI